MSLTLILGTRIGRVSVCVCAAVFKLRCGFGDGGELTLIPVSAVDVLDVHGVAESGALVGAARGRDVGVVGGTGKVTVTREGVGKD